jgi:hypothetical protein
MNNMQIAQAAHELGYDHNFTIENDSQMWHGTDSERIYLTASQIKVITDKATKTEADKATARQAVLDRLGITADEATLLLG